MIFSSFNNRVLRTELVEACYIKSAYQQLPADRSFANVLIGMVAKPSMWSYPGTAEVFLS
jgi:hypothetical protein